MYDFSGFKRYDSTISSQAKIKRILFVSSTNENTHHHIRLVMRIVNLLSEVELTVVCSSDEEFLLRSASYSSTKFIDHAYFKENGFDQYNLVITNRELAAHALHLGYPVLILGENGLGGLVNKHNLNDFESSGFNGRIGGSPKEPVPAELLLNEILVGLNIHDSIQDFEYEATGNCDYVYNSKKWETDILQILLSIHKLHSLIKAKDFQNLLIKCSSGFDLYPSQSIQGETLIINRFTGICVGSLNEMEARIMKDFLSEGTSAGLNISGFSKLDIENFLIELWQEKVLNFRIAENSEL